MRKTIGLLTAVGVLGVMQGVSAADVTGKITLKGKPPEEKAIPLDPLCGKLHQQPLKTRFYVVGQDGGLADTFVYIKEGLDGKAAPAATGTAVLDQVGCEYVPYVLGLQTGQKLIVKNSDPLLHNVHVMPNPSSGNKESNKAQPAGFKPFEYAFDNSEVFLRFKCDVHPWMFSYVGVVPHPYFAVTNEKGEFKIPNVPPGEYVIEAVHRKTHPSGKGISQKIKVGPDGGKADFVVEVPAP